MLLTKVAAASDSSLMACFSLRFPQEPKNGWRLERPKFGRASSVRGHLQTHLESATMTRTYEARQVRAAYKRPTIGAHHPSPQHPAIHSHAAPPARARSKILHMLLLLS